MKPLPLQVNGMHIVKRLPQMKCKLGQNAKSKDFEPVYSLKGKITTKGMRKFISIAFQQFGQEIEEILPLSLVNKYQISKPL